MWRKSPFCSKQYVHFLLPWQIVWERVNACAQARENVHERETDEVKRWRKVSKDLRVKQDEWQERNKKNIIEVGEVTEREKTLDGSNRGQRRREVKVMRGERLEWMRLGRGEKEESKVRQLHERSVPLSSSPHWIKRRLSAARCLPVQSPQLRPGDAYVPAGKARRRETIYHNDNTLEAFHIKNLQNLCCINPIPSIVCITAE